ncbi:MAG: hypothetical protein LBT25_05365, partial [Candidatus Symbiothrix sp.]|nr:hypothetical protein [Candidatus Symbiothrix sp.]
MKATNTLFLLVLLLLSPRIVSAQDDVRQRKDSLLKVIANTQGEDKLNAYKNLHGIYFDELSDQESLERFLALSAAFFKEARNNNQTERQGRLLVTDMIALISLYQFDEADKRMPETIAFLKEQGLTEALYKAYKQWILSFCRRGQYEKALSVLQQIFQQANATNDSEGLFYADYLMGIVYMHQDRLDEAEKRYRQSIETGSKMDKQPDDLLDAYSELCNMLQVTERFDDFFLVAQQTESLLKQVEAKNPGKSYKIAQSNIWTLYAFAYDSMGNFDQTEIYCNKMDSVNKSPVSMGNTTFLRAHIWDARGEYTKALAYIDQAIDLDPTYLHARYTKVKILSHLEKAPRTYSETEKTVEYADSLRNSSFNKQLDELRTQYEVDKITTEKERNRNYFLFALGGCGLLAIALGIWIYYSRLVTKKNRTMVVQIKELQAEQQRRDEEMLRKTTFEMPETTYDFYP